MTNIKRFLILLTFVPLAMRVWGAEVEYDEITTVTSGAVVSNSSYTAYTKSASGTGADTIGWAITFGGNNKSVGTNSNNRSNCTLSSYSQYAVSPVTSSSTASAFVCTSSISDVSKISYTFNSGSNQTSTEVYLIYSSNGTTFSQISLKSGTQGATISSGTEYVFNKCSGYFGLLFKATNASGNWRIDDVSITLYKEKVTATCTNSITITKGDNPAHGTFTINNSGSICIDEGNASTTITATPDAHWHLGAVISSGGGTIGEIVGNSCTVTNISANTTINVTFAEDTKHTVTFQNNGVTLASGGTREVYDGEEVGALPVLASGDACDLTSTTFMGWTEETISTAQADAPTMITAETTITADKTYNAVWAKADIGGGSGTVTASSTELQNAVSSITSGYKSTTFRLTDGINNYTCTVTATKSTQTGTSGWMQVGKISDSRYISIDDALPGAITNISSSNVHNGSAGSFNGTIYYSNTASTTSPIASKSCSGGVTSFSMDVEGGEEDGYIFFSSAICLGNLSITYSSVSYSDYITDCGVGCGTPTLTFASPNVNKFDGEAVFKNPLTINDNDLNAELTYTSSNPAKAEVDAEGNVTIKDAMSNEPIIITASLAKKTVGLDCQRAVKATYTLNIYNRVTWLVNGVSYSDGAPTTQTTEGGEIENFPTDPDGAVVCDGKTFMGWTTAPYEGVSAPGTLYTSSSTIHITENTTFHAVFAESGGIDYVNTFTRITDADDFVNGQRLVIVSNNSSKMLANDFTGGAAPSESAGKITVNDSKYIWTIEETDENGWFQLSSGGVFLSAAGAVSSSSKTQNIVDMTDENEYYSWWTIDDALSTSNCFGLISDGGDTDDDSYWDWIAYLEWSGTGSRWVSYYVTNFSTETYFAFKFYKQDKDVGFQNYSTSCCDEVEIPTVSTLARSTSATITWNNQAGATNGYSVTVKQGETTKFENTSIAAGTSSIDATGLAANTTYTLIVTAKGATCNRSYLGSFTTTDCEDVPHHIFATPALHSLTIKWKAEAATSTVKLFSDEECITEVAAKTSVASPVTFDGLAENTTYYVKIWADGTCVSEVFPFTTSTTAVEIAEWFTDSIRIILDADDNASVLIEDKQERQTSGSSNIAEKLFFAKYFEGEGSMKLISIYNGTADDVDLSTYSINVITRSKNSTSNKNYDLSGLGTIYKGQEIIFFTRPLSSENVYACADSWLDAKAAENSITANPRWIECETGGTLIDKNFIFNGDDALQLKDGSTVIDCFGAATEAPSTSNCRSESSWKAKVRNMDYGKSIADFDAEVQSDLDLYGINLDDDSITLNTARAILFRDLSVTSGDEAVAKNTTTFATFSSEWNGRSLCGSGTTGKGTCNSFKDLGIFDYNAYYATFDSITTIDELSGKRNEDGTYTIPIPKLDTLSCTMMRIKVYEGTTEKASREYKVPIMIDAAATTTDDKYFHSYARETNSADVCRECDVVILGTGTLTKASSDDAKDIPEIHNLTIYPGGTLIVPEGPKYEYTVNSIQFRVEGERSPIAKLGGNLITNDGQVLVSRRINNSRYYFFSLPYDCNIDEVRWSNGTPATNGVDYRIAEYDSETRAIEGSTKGAPGHYKQVTGNTLKAGVGYVIATNDRYLKELVFPMDIGSTNLTSAENTKTTNKVALHQYTGSSSVNNHNWNLIAHPYVSAFNAYEDAQITAGWLKCTTPATPDNPNEGEWEYVDAGNVYLTMPSFNADKTTYTQTLSSTVGTINPFLAVFVQAAAEGDLTFNPGDRILSAPARHLAAQAETEDESIFVGVTLSGNGQSDQTNLRIRPDFTDEYQLGYDLLKFTTYYTERPQIYMKTPSYQLAFQAVNDSVAKNNFLPMGVYCEYAGTYTFALDEHYPIDEVEAVYLYDKTTGTTTNLLYDTYTITTGGRINTTSRFSLNVRLNRKVPQITTGIDGVEAPDGITRKILINGHVYIQRGSATYDVTGKEVFNF